MFVATCLTLLVAILIFIGLDSLARNHANKE